jgi:hypothetical protein
MIKFVIGGAIFILCLIAVVIAVKLIKTSKQTPPAQLENQAESNQKQPPLYTLGKELDRLTSDVNTSQHHEKLIKLQETCKRLEYLLSSENVELPQWLDVHVIPTAHKLINAFLEFKQHGIGDINLITAGLTEVAAAFEDTVNLIMSDKNADLEADIEILQQKYGKLRI